MQIFVKNLLGEQVGLEFEETDTIYDVKSKIMTELNMPIMLQRLSFAGEQLEDRQTLADCKTKEEYCLDLAMRARH